jgi:hypothetical protein
LGGGEADSFALLRNDSQKGKGKRRSRFPRGMTERKARAKAKAGATAGCGVLDGLK